MYSSIKRSAQRHHDGGARSVSIMSTYGDGWYAPRAMEHQRGAAMLVLSRKKNESIIINDNITVTVIEIRGDKVRLGIEAPKHVTVHRREVYEAIQNQARALDADAKTVRPEA